MSDPHAAEAYSFVWAGRAQAEEAAGMPPAGEILPTELVSNEEATTSKMAPSDSQHHRLIIGDNLSVLRLLRRDHPGAVQVVYIDPPYNTGKTEFTYNDRRHRPGSDPRDRRHADWLSFIYPRLVLARDLLAATGTMWISISDAEVHHLRMLCDEIFGEVNFVGNVIWRSTRSVTNTALISTNHTHTLCYARDITELKTVRARFRLPESGEGFANPDNDPKGPWKADPFQVGGERPNQLYPITNPKTGEVYQPLPGNSWKNDHKTFRRLMSEGRIVFGLSGEGGPARKRYLHEAEARGRVATSIWDNVGTTTSATYALKELFDGQKVFTGPKPVGLVRRIVELSTHLTDDEPQIVLDFFAGSGTTGEAVLRQNAEDGLARLVWQVQVQEPTAAKSLARQAGYTDVAQITIDRLRRVYAQLDEDSPLPTQVEEYRD